MKSLKLLCTSLTLPALLGVCSNFTGPIPVVGMSATAEGAAIVSTLTIVRPTDSTPGGLSIQQVATQPRLQVAVSAGSLGVTLTKADITVVDGSGNPFSPKFSQAMSVRVQSGYACKASADAAAPNPANDQCDGLLKVGYRRTVDAGSLAAIGDATTSGLADQFAKNYQNANPCPDLSMNITLYGYDDLNRTIRPLVIRNAPIAETCNIK